MYTKLEKISSCHGNNTGMFYTLKNMKGRRAAAEAFCRSVLKARVSVAAAPLRQSASFKEKVGRAMGEHECGWRLKIGQLRLSRHLVVCLKKNERKK